MRLLDWLAVCLASMVVECAASHRYVALNMGDLADVDLTPHKRVPRGFQHYPTLGQLRHPVKHVHPHYSPFGNQEQEDRREDVQPAASDFLKNIGSYIDFGAHTGDNGAFGWYADYPVRRK